MWNWNISIIICVTAVSYTEHFTDAYQINTGSIITSSSPSLTTQLGNLIIPKVGVGTISWTSSSENRRELQKLVDCHPSTITTNTMMRSSIISSVSNAAVDTSKFQNKMINNESDTPMFFDTAERYGSNLKAAFGMGWGETEILIRDLLLQSTSSSQQQLCPAIVATKFTPSPWRTSVQSVVDACQESCRRLGVDSIDLYQIHMPDIVQPINKIIPDWTKAKDETYWYGLIECYHRGLVKNIGVCNYGPTLLSQCQHVLETNGVPLASNQIAFSILGQQNIGVTDTIAYCRENNIKVMAFFPFAMGLLTGKYTNQRQPISSSRSRPDESLRTSKKTFLENMDLQTYAQQIEPLIEVMQNIANIHGKTISQVALNYIICQGIVPIPGARTKEQYLDNMGSIGWSLSVTELQLLDDTVQQLSIHGFHGAGFKRTSEKFVGYGMEKWALN